MSNTDRSFNESCLGDMLTGRAVGALGRANRQPYWATEHIITWSLHNRLAQASAGRWPSALQPQLAPRQLHPLVRTAVAAMLQLSLHRYHSVAAHAAGCLSALTYSLSSSLQRLLMPSVIAAAALLPSAPDSPGYPPAAVSARGGFRLPEDAADAAQQLAAQTPRLTALICAPESQRPATDAVEGAAVGDGVCTSENKHVVTGALALADKLGKSMSLVTTWPDLLVSSMMAVLVMQRYFLPVRLLCRLIARASYGGSLADHTSSNLKSLNVIQTVASVLIWYAKHW